MTVVSYYNEISQFCVQAGASAILKFSPQPEQPVEAAPIVHAIRIYS